jgi:DNA-binding CsgD family transcriptional regulator
VVGRDAELAALEANLRDESAGVRLLVLEGEPGIGKTTVWREGMSRAEAAGYRVLSCRAAQAESRLSFTGLGDLLAPLESESFAGLPVPQRRSLEVALLRAEADGPPGDPRTIGTALVALLTRLASDSPVLLAVDDVQWLDGPTARALEFAVRRLEDRPVAVLVTLRVSGAHHDTRLASALSPDRVWRSRLGPLGMGALYEVVRDALGTSLTRPLLVRIERASRGNPFYALEIARAAEAGASPVSGETLPIPDDMRGLVARRLQRLPSRTRSELLKLSALGQPTIDLLDEAALEPAVAAGIVRTRPAGRVEFAHPLFVGAVYERASPRRRRELHRELAQLVSDPEERARHLALTVDEPDEEVAAALDRGARRAYQRGAPEAAAELAEQAMRRTPADAAELRWERCLTAAGHHFRGGDTERARALASDLAATEAPGPTRARALCLLAEDRATNAPASGVALLEQALECAGDDLALAAHVETSLGLLAAAVADIPAAESHLARAVELAERAGEPATVAEALGLWALTKLVFGRGLDEASLERALELEDPEREVGFHLRPSLNAAQVYEFTGQIDRARELLVRLRDRMLVRGEEADLGMVRAHLTATSWLAGDLEGAEREATETLRVATLTGREMFRAFALMLRAQVRAIRGDVERARPDAAEALSISERIGWPHGIHQARWDHAILALLEGDASAAVEILEPVLAAVEQMGVYEWPIAMSVPDAVVALIATGDLDRAARLTEALGNWGRTHDRPWALAVSERSKALLAAATGDLDQAQASAARALLEHERLPMPFELGHTLLALGRIQRRRGERRAAREALTRAIEIFDGFGARPWADEARAELRRIGVRRAPEELTENEALVARLAADGLTNREIAARMFISRRTVEANLARAYRKLGIHTRAELGATMAQGGDVGSGRS